MKLSSKITTPLVILFAVLIFGCLCTKLSIEFFESNTSLEDPYDKKDKSNIKFPENDIQIIQRANMSGTPEFGIGAGTYQNIFLKDKVIHQFFLDLPHPTGGFSVHTITQPNFYRCWLVNKKSGDALPIGQATKGLDHKYVLKAETPNTNIFKNYNMAVVTVETDSNATKPGKMILKGGIRSTNGVLCD